LILCVLRPRGFPWKGHLSTDDAVRIIEATKPKSAIITDFGMRMIRANPPQEAKYIEESTGIPTVAAVDNMCIELDSRLPEPSLRHSSAE